MLQHAKKDFSMLQMSIGIPPSMQELYPKYPILSTSDGRDEKKIGRTKPKRLLSPSQPF